MVADPLAQLARDGALVLDGQVRGGARGRGSNERQGLGAARRSREREEGGRLAGGERRSGRRGGCPRRRAARAPREFLAVSAIPSRRAFPRGRTTGTRRSLDRAS